MKMAWLALTIKTIIKKMTEVIENRPEAKEAFHSINNILSTGISTFSSDHNTSKRRGQKQNTVK